MPHHMEDLERQIPYSLEKTSLKSNSRGMPGGGGGGGGGNVEVSNWSVHKYYINIEGAILKKIGQKRSLYVGIGKFNMTGKCLSRPPPPRTPLVTVKIFCHWTLWLR
jgi:hypothetical protein